MSKTKQVDPIPDEFRSYEEAGEFWDTHDTTDYSNIFRTVEADPHPRQTRPRSRRHGMSTAVQKGPRTKTVTVVERGLWQSNDRLDYHLYLKQVALLPQEPMTYRP
jgi:hypothetical protein